VRIEGIHDKVTPFCQREPIAKSQGIPLGVVVSSIAKTLGLPVHGVPRKLLPNSEHMSIAVRIRQKQVVSLILEILRGLAKFDGSARVPGPVAGSVASCTVMGSPVTVDTNGFAGAGAVDLFDGARKGSMIGSIMPSEACEYEGSQMICFDSSSPGIGSRRARARRTTQSWSMFEAICSAWGKDLHRLRVAVHGQHGATRETLHQFAAEPRWRERPSNSQTAGEGGGDNSPML